MLWDWAVSDNDAARALLEEFYLLPDAAPRSSGELEERLASQGLHFITEPDGTAGRSR
ncbi:hypothetical protein [Nonomuraea angiospora]|uniref:hypothetical protein n=1 Tax=Nonomuraea angiospora TaxID=46172 RepID=UPI0029A31171|nr:hypothetical protein [Nonomuraea angiospora]MDX3099955.1 hypothetical protein [Nonomuraea angiospora]